MPSFDGGEVIHGGVRYRFSNAWIRQVESREHWMLYWQQAKLIERYVQSGGDLVELGVGSGFLAHYLRSRGRRVTTVDIDPGKNPDVVANIAEYDCGIGCDYLLAFEVFEHVPFQVMLDFLRRAKENIRSGILMSVPHARRPTLIDLTARLPFLGERRMKLELPKALPMEEHHFWELGDGTITVERLVAGIGAVTGLRLIDEVVCDRHFFVFGAEGKRPVSRR